MTDCLEQVKVIEMGHVIAIPSAAAILADWGADVIKIEIPGVGDQLRGITHSEGGPITNDIHYIFEVVNRNKRGITLNLMHEKGKEIMYELVKKSDVFMTNFQPSALVKMGLEYRSLSELNPMLIYASLTGYGSKGPNKDKPGYDYAAFWANSGLMDKVSDPHSAPRRQRPSVGDNVASMCITAGISAALFARERTGKGQELSFSLYNTGVWTLQTDIQVALSMEQQLPYGDIDKAANPLWNTYQTKDGRWLELCMLQSDLFWPRFCDTVGLGHLINDPRFVSSQKRADNCEALIAMIKKVFSEKTLIEWEEILEQNELFSCRVRTVQEVVNDPQAIENDFFTDLDHYSGRRIRLVASPVLFDQVRPPVRCPAPELGQHVEEILLELGYDWNEISSFRDNGII